HTDSFAQASRSAAVSDATARQRRRASGDCYADEKRQCAARAGKPHSSSSAGCDAASSRQVVGPVASAEKAQRRAAGQYHAFVGICIGSAQALLLPYQLAEPAYTYIDTGRAPSVLAGKWCARMVDISRAQPDGACSRQVFQRIFHQNGLTGLQPFFGQNVSQHTA